MRGFERVIVLGAGRSGQAAQRLLEAEGAEAILVAEELGGVELLEQVLALVPDYCVVSPGFALEHPWMVAVQEAGVPLLSELELGWSRHRGKTVAVTGSNGKSTAVKWLAEMLEVAGHSVGLGGNYGIPACEVVWKNPDADWLVLEVSSFQLETMQAFQPDVGVLLNVLPNHLNRHGTMEVYRAAKMRLFEQMTAQQVAIVPEGEVPPSGEMSVFTFGAGGDFVFENGVVLRQGEEVLRLEGTLFNNPVLGSCTGAAVAAVAQAVSCSREAVEQAAAVFEPLPHRLEHVGVVGGVVYVNDSKATNLAAMRAALQACGKRIRLIAGGLPKEHDYTFMKEILAERALNIYLIGQASQAMLEAWGATCSCVDCGTLEAAFDCAQREAVKGDLVLLSPGCASFDQFERFEERGEQFTALVKALASNEG